MTQTSEKPETIAVAAEYDGYKIAADPKAWNEFVLDIAEQLRAQVHAHGRVWNTGITSASVEGYDAVVVPPKVTLRMEWVSRAPRAACEVHPGGVHEHCLHCGLPVWPDEEPADHECPPGFDL